MADIFNAQKRREIMASVSAKNTAPEMFLRKCLHQRGFRYRLHDKRLPGTPDLVFRRFNAVVFINGCFWHGHDCPLFRIPSSNREFWQKKFDTNRTRDAQNKQLLMDKNWRMLIVWECSMRGRGKLAVDELVSRVENWLQSENNYMEVRGSAGVSVK